jgi:hypothetical protein
MNAYCVAWRAAKIINFDVSDEWGDVLRCVARVLYNYERFFHPTICSFNSPNFTYASDMDVIR